MDVRAALTPAMAAIGCRKFQPDLHASDEDPATRLSMAADEDQQVTSKA